MEVSTSLPVALAAQPFTINANESLIVEVNVANQRLSVVPSQILPQQPYVIRYELPTGVHTFSNLNTDNQISLTPVFGTTVSLIADWFIATPPNPDLNTLGWETGDVIVYNDAGTGSIPGLISGEEYFLIVYRPGFSERGLIKENDVDNCIIAGYVDGRLTTASAWINNVAVLNGVNYDIDWVGVRPIDEGPIDSPPINEHKSYNLSLN